MIFIGKIRAANSNFKFWPFSTSQISLWPLHNEQKCTKAFLLWLSGRSELNLARIRGPHFLFAPPNSDWRANLVKDFLLNNFSTNESTQIITGHVIYNPAYTYNFQLKTTLVTLGSYTVVIMLKAMAFLNLSAKNSNHGRESVRRSQFSQVALQIGRYFFLTRVEPYLVFLLSWISSITTF